MTEFIFFLMGMMVGGLTGIVTMCLFQINSINKCGRKDDKDAKNN